MPPSSRVPIATRSRSSRRRRRTALPDLLPAAPRAHGRVAVRLLPRHAGGHGLRPGRHAADRHPRPGQRRRPPLQLRPVRARPSGRSSSTPTTSTRRCPGPGSGTSSGSPRASSSPAGQRLQRRAEPRRDDGDRPRLSPVDGALRRHAPDRRLVRVDHRRGHPGRRRGGRPPRRASQAARAARALEAVFSKARGADGMRAFESLTAVVDGRRVIIDDPPVVTHVELDRRRQRRSRRSSPTTGRRCPRTGASSSSAIASSTSRSRSSASGASGHAAS